MRTEAKPRLPCRFFFFASLSICTSYSFLISPRKIYRLPLMHEKGASGNKASSSKLLSSNYGQDDQVMEAIESLVNFHEGTWKGRARSFTVVPDIAAGIVQRKVSPEYETSVRLGVNLKDKDFSLTETFCWNDGGMLSSRSLSLNECNVDVDSVDASYSLDSTLPDLPSVISGTDKLCQFGIEHCIVASEERRMRCFVFYGVDQSLQRVVVCEETRIKHEEKTIANTMGENNNKFTARDLLEIQSDVDRLVDKLTGSIQSEGAREEEGSSPSSPEADDSSTSESRLNQLGESLSSAGDDGARKLSLHDTSLLELASGVWLGDSIIRDIPMVPSSPLERGQGFGGEISRRASPEKTRTFGWSVGVQKVAFRMMWNFGEECRQVIDVGKAMGAELIDCMSQSLSGTVCVNEGLKRRMSKDERMVYIDYAREDMVGFLVGPVSIQCPRYLNFNQAATKTVKPFFTEFGLFQGGDEPSEQNQVPIDDFIGNEGVSLPELCCSKISRAYNFEGKLKQGCTSFYTFKRFGADDP